MADNSTSDLQRKIEAKIEEVKAYASDIPGVIIIHSLLDWSLVWMSPNGLKQIGVSLEEITGIRTEEYHNRFFNADDAKEYSPKIRQLLERNNNEESCSYFQQVRLAGHEDWTWHISSTKILLWDDAGKPILTISVAIPIDTIPKITVKAERILEENAFLRRHYNDFAKLSNREREILRQSALGKTSSEIAEELHISVATVDTHRKNIRNKLNITSFYEINQYARAFDLI
ncbi:helix-turn-helix transcriptional regulator [Adhaeribacter aquaticus]|uniref:helix-turn-helix transcriptional regulator n=1 Tax=Adhaeribacter aquaticus TaxID=299567 RepID=UPI00040FE27E|nr:helix-turn-helix transcriptional regulator [Adhaeribacter aquaticus]